MLQSVTKIVQTMVLDGQIPVKKLAERVNKPYATLLRELNPYDSGAKLGVETLVDIMRVTQNTDPLRHMADELGYTLVPKSRIPETTEMYGILQHEG